MNYFWSNGKAKIEQIHENNMKNLEVEYQKNVELEKKNFQDKLNILNEKKKKIKTKLFTKKCLEKM